RAEFLVEPRGEPDRRSATEGLRPAQDRRMLADTLQPRCAEFDVETAPGDVRPVVRMGLPLRMQHQVRGEMDSRPVRAGLGAGAREHEITEGTIMRMRGDPAPRAVGRLGE